MRFMGHPFSWWINQQTFGVAKVSADTLAVRRNGHFPLVAALPVMENAE